MKTAMGTKQGTHDPLIDAETFARCQEVFRLKHTGGQPRHKLDFQLAGVLKCPKRERTLTSERHTKKSGKVYRYYRCHRNRPTSEGFKR